MNRVSLLIAASWFAMTQAPLGLAQSVPQPTIAGISREVRSHKISKSALDVLTQENGPQSQTLMSAVADTLTLVAVRSDPRILEETGTNAVLTLGRSVRSESGKPYSAGVANLMRIAQTANNVGIRSMAVAAIAQSPDPATAVKLLSEIAQSNNPAASTAIRWLDQPLGAHGGISALQTMRRNNSITDRRALDELRAVAQRYKW